MHGVYCVFSAEEMIQLSYILHIHIHILLSLLLLFHTVGCCSIKNENKPHFALIHWGTWHVALDYRMIMYYEGQLLSASELPTCAADRMLTSPVRQLNKADSSAARCSHTPTQSLTYQACKSGPVPEVQPIACCYLYLKLVVKNYEW